MTAEIYEVFYLTLYFWASNKNFLMKVSLIYWSTKIRLIDSG